MFDLRPLRLASFRHLALGYWVNEFGTWIGEIALTVLVYDRTHSPLGTAALFLALRFAPAFFAPFLTAFVETVTPRVVLALTYSLEAALFFGIAVIAGHFSMPAILALSILDGALAITAKALTRSATAAGLREAELLREGNGILNLGLMSSQACAPIVAGALVAWKGPRAALIVDAATFLLTAMIIATAAGIHTELDEEASFSHRLRAGAGAIRERAAMQRLMGAVALGMMFTSIPIPIEVVFAKHELHAGAFGYGVMLASWGLGMVLGAAAFALLRSVRLMRLLGIGTLIVAMGYAGLAAAPTLAVACIASAVGGTGNGAGWIAAVTSIQERIPLQAQSAVMTLLEGLNQVMPAIGFVTGGLLTAIVSPRLAYAVASAGVVLLVAGIAGRPIDSEKLADKAPDQSSDRNEEPTGAPQDSDGVARSSPLPTLTAR